MVELAGAGATFSAGRASNAAQSRGIGTTAGDAPSAAASVHTAAAAAGMHDDSMNRYEYPLSQLPRVTHLHVPSFRLAKCTGKARQGRTMANAANYSDSRSAFEIANLFAKQTVDGHFAASRLAGSSATADQGKISITFIITHEGTHTPWVYFSCGAKTADRVALLTQAHASECPPIPALPPLADAERARTLVRLWPKREIAQLIAFFRKKADMAVFFYQVFSQSLV